APASATRSRRVPIANNDATLGELASGWLDAPAPRREAVADHHAAPVAAVSFDEFDELSGYDTPDVWADVEPTPAARRWAERVGLSAVDPLIARVGAL